MIVVYIIVGLLFFLLGWGIWLTFGPGKEELRDAIDDPFPARGSNRMTTLEELKPEFYNQLSRLIQQKDFTTELAGYVKYKKTFKKLHSLSVFLTITILLLNVIWIFLS